MHFYFKLRRLILQLCVVNCQRPILSHDKPWKLSCAHFYCHRFHLKSFLSLPSGDKTNYCTGSAVWIQCPHEKLLDIEGLPFPHGWAASRLSHIFCSSLFSLLFSHLFHFSVYCTLSDVTTGKLSVHISSCCTALWWLLCPSLTLFYLFFYIFQTYITFSHLLIWNCRSRSI